MPQVPTYFRTRLVLSLIFFRAYSNPADTNAPDLIRSRSGYNPSEGSTIPSTVSDVSDNNRNISKANYFNTLHDRAGIDTAYNPSLKKHITDPSHQDIEKLADKFSECKTDSEAQDLYDTTKAALVSAYNAVVASNNDDLQDSLAIARVKASDNSTLNMLNSQANTSHASIEKDNTSHLSVLISELNVSASSYKGYDNLSLQRDSQYYKEIEGSESTTGSEGSVSTTGSVEEISTNKTFKQDSSDIHQTDFNSFDPFDE